MNALLAALQRGPEAIRLPGTPFTMPVVQPGQAQPDAGGASFSRMMMGQLLAAMDRTVPAPQPAAIAPNREGVPTVLAAPPPGSGPVVGPPPGRGSPGTAGYAVPLADGGNTPGQQETDRMGTSSGVVRPLTALPASSLTRLTAASHALIRLAAADPTAVEPLRGAMLRSLDGMAVAPALPAAGTGGVENAEAAEPNPLRPLRRALETAPTAELLSLARLIVQSAPAPLPVVAPELPRPVAPAQLPQPGQRFQDVLAAVSARADDAGVAPVEAALPASRPIPVTAGGAAASVDASDDLAAPSPPAAPDPALPRSGRAVVVGLALAPEAEVGRSAVTAYDASSRFAPRPAAGATGEPLPAFVPTARAGATVAAHPATAVVEPVPAFGPTAGVGATVAAHPATAVVEPVPAFGPTAGAGATVAAHPATTVVEPVPANLSPAGPLRFPIEPAIGQPAVAPMTPITAPHGAVPVTAQNGTVDQAAFTSRPTEVVPGIPFSAIPVDVPAAAVTLAAAPPIADRPATEPGVPAPSFDTGAPDSAARPVAGDGPSPVSGRAPAQPQDDTAHHAPTEDAGALFARIHAAASGRTPEGEPAAASRPAYPALAEALDRIATELTRAAPGSVRSLEMNLDAPDLGRVRIRVALTEAGTVGIELVAPSERAASALRADLPQLTASLEGRGQAVTGAQVTVASVGFMAGQQEGSAGQGRSQHRWFEARGGRRSDGGDEEAPVAGGVASYQRRWSSVDLVA